ncbi:chitin deacetylase [Dinochytrium kinnereticum]|nr:chitin deacetylase [Dinochytrium kinnereticum]
MQYQQQLRRMKNLIAPITVLGLLALSSLVSAQYPAGNAIPPSNPEWNSRYLDNLPSEGAWVRNLCSDGRAWALTYDDGPSDNTRAVLDTLDGVNGQKATFFVVGTRLLDGGAQEMLRRAYRAGHQIAIHTWSHSRLTSLTNEQIVAEVMWTGRIIQDVIGVFPRYMRPPYGAVDDRVLRVMRALGMEVINWNVVSIQLSSFLALRKSNSIALLNISSPQDSLDWQNAASTMDRMNEGIANNRGRNGVISLQHDIETAPVQAGLPAVRAVLDAGFNLRTVEYCVGGPRAYMDGSGSSGGNNNGGGAGGTTTRRPPLTSSTSPIPRPPPPPTSTTVIIPTSTSVVIVPTSTTTSVGPISDSRSVTLSIPTSSIDSGASVTTSSTSSVLSFSRVSSPTTTDNLARSGASKPTIAVTVFGVAWLAFCLF